MSGEGAVPFPAHMRVVIVGAGPAGLGVARVLRDLAVPDVWVLERGAIGQSFLDWPSDTRLLTPSFPGNAFGVTDLNAITFDTSPAWTLRAEHPDGPTYADYLTRAAEAFRLNVHCGVEVRGLAPKDDKFALTTNRGRFTADFVIWACGQFSAPSTGDLPGAKFATHYSRISRWRDVPGDEIYVVGGYESGIDAAIGLAEAGKRPIVLDRGAPWLDDDKDPSRSLSPYSLQRLERAFERDLPIKLTPNADVVALDQEGGGVRIFTSDGRSWLTAATPILATGFGSGTATVSEWFDYDRDGTPILTEQDESTALPGLFLVGPEVAHNGHLFCFIYKFRQRFAVVANAIATRMDVDTSILEEYHDNNMFLDDLTCCDDDKCVC